MNRTLERLEFLETQIAARDIFLFQLETEQREWIEEARKLRAQIR